MQKTRGNEKETAGSENKLAVRSRPRVSSKIAKIKTGKNANGFVIAKGGTSGDGDVWARKKKGSGSIGGRGSRPEETGGLKGLSAEKHTPDNVMD